MTGGLRLAVHGFKHPVLTPIAFGAACAAYILAVDAAFGQINAMARGSLLSRLAYTIPRSIEEAVIYQLVLGTAFVWLLLRVWRGREGFAVMAGLLAAHGVNLYLNLFAVHYLPLTAPSVTYELLRFGMPGVLWAWLYWRHGWLSVPLAHAMTHVFYQPAIAAWVAFGR